MRRTVLIVDDDPDIRDVLADIITLARGHDVVHAADGSAGLAALAALNGPCVLILDLDLPDMRGEDVVRQVYAGGSDGIVTLVCSAGIEQRSPLPVAVFEVVGKPFEITVIVDAIDRAFRHLEASGHRFDP